MHTTGSSSFVRLNSHKPGRRISGCLIVVGLLILLGGISPYIAPFGYCRDWWLSSSPWAYYWWLCDCGPEFERSLQPDNVEIVVSACSFPREATLSPDGRYMIVGTALNNKSYLIDFVTGDKQPWPYRFSAPIDVEFWTDTLAIVRTTDPRPELVDVTDGSIVKLSHFSAPKEGLKLIVPPEVLQAFQERKKIIIVEPLTKVTNIALALDPHPKQNHARNYALAYSEDEQEQLIAMLTANGIEYKTIKLCSSYEGICPSHDGRFFATSRQIWTADKKLLAAIPDNPTFNQGIILVGWAHDDSGVYLLLNPDSFVIRGDFVVPSKYRLPQPIVKLKVPAENLPVNSQAELPGEFSPAATEAR